MDPKLRLLLIDDHNLFREGLRRLIEADGTMEVAGDFADAAQASRAIDMHVVDVILLDCDLGEQRGLDFIEKFRSLGFAGRILMVTAEMSDEETLHALQMGVAGICLKHSSPSELLAAVRQVSRGDHWLDARSMRLLVDQATRQRQKSRDSSFLTERERRVLKGVFQGLTNKEIGTTLNISESYVKAILQQLFDKTGVRNRSQLVRIALERYAEYGLGLHSD